MSLICPSCRRNLPAGTATCPHDGSPLGLGHRSGSEADQSSSVIVDDDSLTGTVIDEYTIGPQLGSGGMGEVYAAEQPRIGKKVAIKVLRKEAAANKDAVARMLTEARAVNAIRHRSIVDIFNMGMLPDGRPYLVMEYLVGQPLDALLRTRGALPPEQACAVLEELCGALDAAHGAGVVHRDLKPANVFLLTDPATGVQYVKLLDFGIAKARHRSSAETQVGVRMGTPAYIAPEQALGLPVTAHTDLYSLGAMAFELLTGHPPFSATTALDLMRMHVEAPPPKMSSFVANLPPQLDELVDQLLSKRPFQRGRSADAVRRGFKRLRISLAAPQPQLLPVLSKRAAPVPPVAPVARRAPRAFALAAVALALVGAWGLLSPGDTPGPVVAPSQSVVTPSPRPLEPLERLAEPPEANPQTVDVSIGEPEPVKVPVSHVRSQLPSPTAAELNAELARVVALPNRGPLRPLVLANMVAGLRRSIVNAATPAARREARAALRRYEQLLAPIAALPDAAP